MGTHNICLYKEVDKKYTGCNLKTAELLDSALIEVFVVIRSNTVIVFSFLHEKEIRNIAVLFMLRKVPHLELCLFQGIFYRICPLYSPQV